MRSTVSFYSDHKARGSHNPHFSLSFFAGAGLKFHFRLFFIWGAVPGEGSNPVSCRKYLWSANLVFRRNYARNWLCTAIYGHNIFFGHNKLVRVVGFEPTRPCGHWHLKPARLPVPTHPRIKIQQSPTEYIILYHNTFDLSSTFSKKYIHYFDWMRKALLTL